MPGRKGKGKSQGNLGVLIDFAHSVNDVFQAVSGKTVPEWLKEFRQRPRELPPGGEVSSSDTMSLVNAYSILGLPQTASLEEVKRNYRNLAMAFHSDRGAMNDEAMKLLNRAYERITKEKREG